MSWFNRIGKEVRMVGALIVTAVLASGLGAFISWFTMKSSVQDANDERDKADSRAAEVNRQLIDLQERNRNLEAARAQAEERANQLNVEDTTTRIRVQGEIRDLRNREVEAAAARADRPHGTLEQALRGEHYADSVALLNSHLNCIDENFGSEGGRCVNGEFDANATETRLNLDDE